METQEEAAGWFREHMGTLGSGARRGRGSFPPVPTPRPVHPLHLAGPELEPFIINL